MTESASGLTLTLIDGTQITAPNIQKLAIEWAKQQNPTWLLLSPEQQQREIDAASTELIRYLARA